MPEMFLVGGAVRDKLLGLKPKDLDYVVIAENYESMKQWLLAEKISQIFLEKPEYGTIRARLSSGEAGDFVLARKEGYYTDGRRPDSTEPGTLMDDLLRRDFTVNAMAEDEGGRIIDPFGGRRDLYALVLRTVRDPKEVFAEDALRMYRAIRFRVTKGFAPTAELHRALNTVSVLDNLPNVSLERVREELYKCYKHNTLATNFVLDFYPALRDYAFKGSGMWLKPTMED